MLRIAHISLVQFKNYSNRSFDFSDRIVGICGQNGAGKTNMLDAIHYFCFTKSYFTRQDGNNVQHGKAGFRLEAEFNLHDKTEKAVCILRETGKKEFTINEQAYSKFSHHIGHYPCVVIAPDDAQLITGHSEERRKFLDELLSQLDADYLQDLILYSRILQQRNSLLRSFAETREQDLSLLDVIDEQLTKPGERIFARRKEFLVSFLPLVRHLYHDIAARAGESDSRLENITAEKEDVNLFYESELLEAEFPELLRINRNKDLVMMRTSSGIHRDDLEMEMGSRDFKIIASQGQRKSLLFALKLGELEVLKKEKGFSPLLLLDDVFEKLDESRISNLLQKVCVENDGQVFITDTNEERLRSHLEKIGVEFQLISL